MTSFETVVKSAIGRRGTPFTENGSRRFTVSDFLCTHGNGMRNAMETESALTVYSYSARL